VMLPPDNPPLVSGVIINKPTDVRLNDLFRHSIAIVNGNDKVYFGGPVELNSPLMVVHGGTPPPQSIGLGGDAYAIDDVKTIADSLKTAHGFPQMRFYLGRAQWTQDQLRGEILSGAWDVMALRTDVIFEHDPSKVWPELIVHEHVREVHIDCRGGVGIIEFPQCGGASLYW
jgi:putative transcriptional regulator